MATSVVVIDLADGRLIFGSEGNDDDFFEERRPRFFVAESVATKIVSVGGSLEFGSGGGSDCFCGLRFAFGGGSSVDDDDYFSSWCR